MEISFFFGQLATPQILTNSTSNVNITVPPFWVFSEPPDTPLALPTVSYAFSPHLPVIHAFSQSG